MSEAVALQDRGAVTCVDTGVVTVAGVFRDILPKEYNNDKTAVRLLNRLLDKNSHSKVEMPIALLNATQKTVNEDYREAAERHAKLSQYRLPAVVRYKGVFYVTDGHHRIMAEHAKGKITASIRLFDLDQKDLKMPLFEGL